MTGVRATSREQRLAVTIRSRARLVKVAMRVLIECSSPLVRLSAESRTMHWLLIAAAAGCGGPAVRLPGGAPYDSASTEQLASGVVHRRLIANSGPFTINVVEVPLRRRDIDVAAAHAFDSLRGRERTSAIVARQSGRGTDVIAAVNADFFSLRTGENENNQVIAGEVLKGVPITDSPFDSLHTIHSQFAVTCDGHPLIERFAFSGAVLTPPPTRATLPLDAMNFRPPGDATVLYTSPYGTTPSDSLSRLTVETRLRIIERRGDTLVLQAAGGPRSGGGIVIHPGEAVLSGSGVAAEVVRRLAQSLAPSAPLRILTTFSPRRGRICTLVGGWPRIVASGRSIADSVDRLEGTFSSFSATRHPRTGVGFSRDSATLYLITVDGRSESSSGMSLGEFAALMQSLGIAHGLNLDGGGSTTLIINGRVINHPSDSAGERTVGNALLITRRR
jgi:hypothetical protein